MCYHNKLPKIIFYYDNTSFFTISDGLLTKKNLPKIPYTYSAYLGSFFLESVFINIISLKYTFLGLIFDKNSFPHG